MAISQQLLEYIRQQMAMGTTKENIQRFLVDSGWSQSDIDAAFEAVASQPVQKRGVVGQIVRGVFWILGILFLLSLIAAGVFAVYVLNQTKHNVDSGQATESEKTFFTSVNAALIQGGLLAFNVENEKYPSSLDELVPRYLQEVPIDPVTSQPYRYVLTEAGAGYTLCTIKNGQDVCATARMTIDGEPLDY